MSDYVVVYSKYITVKGQRVYAWQRGLKAFRLEIPRDKFKQR